MFARETIARVALAVGAAALLPMTRAEGPSPDSKRAVCPAVPRDSQVRRDADSFRSEEKSNHLRVTRASYRPNSGHEPDIISRAASAGTFRTLINALVVAELFDTLRTDGPFTVFAPNDDAFAKIPARELSALLAPEGKEKLRTILGLHVVPGKLKANALASKGRVKTVSGASLSIAENRHGLAVNEATVVKANIECGNGIIHVIDRVLLPSASSTDILGLASSKKSFRVLVSAIKGAGLEEALRGEGPFTVLAPTDEAFAKLPKDTLASLLKPAGRAKLAEILKYHVIPGKLSARQVVSAGRAKTLQGGAVEATIEEGRLVINGAKVLATDLEADNGIIHAIDTVLVPR